MPKSIKKVSVFAVTTAVVAAVSLILAVAPALVHTDAHAKITPETHNKPNQGNPQGNGNGLITENVNPAGSAPPGQNK